MRLSISLRLTVIACLLGVAGLAGPVRAIDPKHLPDDAELILVVNFQQILNSDIAKANKDVVTQLKFLVDNQLAGLGAQRYLERLDFDLFRDVTTAMLATDGGKMPTFLLLEGNFNAAKFTEIGEEASRDNAEHIKPVKIAGLQAFEIRINADDKPVYAGLVGNNRLLAAGSQDRFADSVARLGGAKQAKLKKPLADLLNGAAAKQSLTLVTTGPALVKLLNDAPVPNIDALQDLLGDVSALNISLAFSKNVHFELAVNAKNQKAAGEIAKLTDVGIAGAKLLLKKKVETDPNLAPALDIVNSLRIATQGANFVLSGDISGEALAKLLKDLPK